MWEVLGFPVATAGVALAALLASDGTLSAASFTVNSTIDAVDANPGDGICDDGGGRCTLRAAIMEANALPGVDMIVLPAGTYTLSIPGAGEDVGATGDLDITDDVRIAGSLIVNGGAEPASIVDAAGLDRVIHVVGSVSVEMSGVELRNGDVSGEFALGGGL